MRFDIFRGGTERKPTTLVKLIATLSAFALMASGCARPSLSPETPQSPVGQTQSQLPDIISQFDSPYKACGSSYTSDSDEIIHAAAKSCLDLYKDTDIALVNFTLPEEDAMKLADDVEEQINHTSKNIITADVVAIPASEEALKLFADQNADGCVDIYNLYEYGSFIAAATMQETDEYDVIVGVTDEPSCTANVGGVANPSYGGRYADVFNAGENNERVNNNDGKYWEIQPDGSSRSLLNNSLIIAHEIYHLLNLGHAGTIYINDGEKDLALNEIGWYAKKQLLLGLPVSIDSFVSEGHYSEYGADNVMGNPTELRPEQTLDLTQIYTLDEPNRALDYVTPLVKEYTIGDNPIIFDSESIDIQGLAMLHLGEPLSMPVTDSKASPLSTYEEFRTIAFEPKYISNPEYGLSGVQSLKLYIVGNKGSSVLLGTLFESDTAYQFVVQDHTITVEFTDGRAMIYE